MSIVAHEVILAKDLFARVEDSQKIRQDPLANLTLSVGLSQRHAIFSSLRCQSYPL
jgi:hypothetical protein